MKVMDFQPGKVRDKPVYAAENSRAGIVVDAACDLPPDFFADPDVAVIPVMIKIGDKLYIDRHNPDSTTLFLREQGSGKAVTATSAPLTVYEMQGLFLERFSLDYDSVYCLTVASTRSPIYENAMKASTQTLNAARQARQSADIRRPFQFRVIDTQNLFAAQGLPALVLRDLIKSGASPKDIRDRLFQVIDATYGYVIPDDLQYMRARARLRGDRSVGLVTSILGNAMDIKPIVRGRLGTTTPVGKFRGRAESWKKLFAFTCSHVQRGLLSPHVVVSYGGPLNDLYDTPGYQTLVNICQNEGVQLHACQMSITGMVNIGTRALSVGFAAEEHSPNF